MRGRPVRPGGVRGFFVSAGGGAGGPNRRSIDAPEFPVDVSLVVQFDLQRLDDGGEDAAFAPDAEMVVHRLPGAEAFRQIAPGGAGGKNPKDAVELRSSIAGRASRPSRAERQMRFDQRPLLVRELVAFHRWRPPSRPGNLLPYRVFRQSLGGSWRHGQSLLIPRMNHPFPPRLASSSSQR